VRRQLLAGVIYSVLPTSLWLLGLLGHDAGSGVLTNDGKKVGKRLGRAWKRWEKKIPLEYWSGNL
jgi:hypothetical protein